MRDAPRRRRSDEESGGGGLPLFPLMVVVVLAGLLLGGVLAHFFGGKNGAPAPASTMVAGNAPQEPTPAPISPPPSAAPEPSATPVPSATSSPTAAASPSPKATQLITPRPPPATPKPKTAALATSEPARKPAVTATQLAANVTASPATARPATAPPATTPPAPAHTVSPSGNTHAASVVRSYLEALAHGDRGTASTYLAHGYPTESFMNSESRIESISSANVGGQQYRVGADVQTSSGEYFITFTLQQSAGGMLITDHSAIKPQ